MPATMESALTAPGEHLLIVSSDRDFVATCQRACEVVYEGDCTDCDAEAAPSAVARSAPRVVILHGDEHDDCGLAAVARIRRAPNGAHLPVLVIGSRMNPLDRWHLGATGAFAVRLPVKNVEVLATVLVEGLAFARAPDDGESSRPRPLLCIGASPSGELPVEAFLLLAASSWSGGLFPERACSMLLDAVGENHLGDDALAAVDGACTTPLPLLDVDVSELLEADRWYLYSFAVWIALLDGEVTPRAWPTLHVLAFTFGLSPRTRASVQAVVERHRRVAPDATHFRRADFTRLMLPDIEQRAGVTLSMPAAVPEDVASDEGDALVAAS